MPLMTFNPASLPQPNLIGPWVDVRSFAPPNKPRGPVDCDQDPHDQWNWTDAIQNAVNYLVARSIGVDHDKGYEGTNVGTLYLPPGIYRITRPIEISLINDPLE